MIAWFGVFVAVHNGPIMLLSDLGPSQAKMSHFAVILYSVSKIRDYTSEGKEAFLCDTRTQDAVCYRLVSIFEALKKITDELRWLDPISVTDVEEMRHNRNRLAHEPNNICPIDLWSLVERFLPIFTEALKEVPGYASLSFIENAQTVSEKHLVKELKPIMDSLARTMQGVVNDQKADIRRQFLILWQHEAEPQRDSNH